MDLSLPAPTSADLVVAPYDRCPLISQFDLVTLHRERDLLAYGLTRGGGLVDCRVCLGRALPLNGAGPNPRTMNVPSP